MSGGADYHASWWRLRELGQRDLLVPLSCCELDNADDADGFLDPRPSNLTLCQSLQHEAARPHRHMEVRTPSPLIGRDTKAACTCSIAACIRRAAGGRHPDRAPADPARYRRYRRYYPVLDVPQPPHGSRCRHARPRRTRGSAMAVASDY